MVAKLADHTIISIIIAVQFLFCLFWLLTTLWYGDGSAHPYVLLMSVAYGGAGIVTAILLQKKGQSWIQPPTPSPRQRIPVLLWNSLLPGYAILHGKVNWQNPFDSFDSYATIYGLFVVAYLTATSAIGVVAGGAVPQSKEKP
jgi:hypothetical protein